MICGVRGDGPQEIGENGVAFYTIVHIEGVASGGSAS
jgi:hypothetical protein